MANLDEYKRMWVESLQARADGDESKEDEILSRMDDIWYDLTPEETEAMHAFAKVVRARLDKEGNVIAPLTGIL